MENEKIKKLDCTYQMKGKEMEWEKKTDKIISLWNYKKE